jgi:hypothetical protein
MQDSFSLIKSNVRAAHYYYINAKPMQHFISLLKELLLQSSNREKNQRKSYFETMSQEFSNKDPRKKERRRGECQTPTPTL